MLRHLRLSSYFKQEFSIQLQFSPASNFKRAQSNDSQKIVIPKRIERGPTDILRALSNTVGRDPTAAHYKYHDDPYFIPMSNVGKRTFAMAQEAGKKAAKWVVKTHPEVFGHKLSDPPIEAFMPKTVYNEQSDVAESTLLQVIDGGHVSDAIIIHDLLNKKGVELSKSTKQSLLELLCFYNSDDSLPEDLTEERWFTKTVKPQERKTWKDYGVAENIFKSLGSDSAEACSTLIQGMVKYGQFERALELYQTTQEKGLVLDVGAYNGLMQAAGLLKQDPEMKWEQIKLVLNAMAREKIHPNIATLNSILMVFTTAVHSPNVKDWLLKTLSEFKRLGIEPSLGSYHYVLLTLCKEKGPINLVLNDIITLIEGKELEIRYPQDVNFFVTAMQVCNDHLHDISLARRLDDLLHYGNNYDLIGDSFKESIYYRNYFTLLINSDTLEKVMEVYDVYVPHIYTPEPSVMQEILKAVDLNGAMEHFPRLWSDIVIFDQADRIQLVTFLMDSLVRNQPADGDELNVKFSNIAQDVWEKIENQPINRLNKISWSGEMLSNAMILFTRAQEFDKASLVMRKLDKEQNSFIGEPSVEALCGYLDLCIQEKNVNQAMVCLQYCSEMGFPEVTSMVKQVKEKLTLTDLQTQKLANLTSADVD